MWGCNDAGQIFADLEARCGGRNILVNNAEVADPARMRVNAVCPASVSDPRIEAVIRRDAEQRSSTADEVRHVYQRHTSMRSFVTADEVADTVFFLSSAQAAKISGQSIAVDGHTEGLSNWLD